jgi:hypothetical protein
VQLGCKPMLNDTSPPAMRQLLTGILLGLEGITSLFLRNVGGLTGLQRATSKKMVLFQYTNVYAILSPFA